MINRQLTIKLLTLSIIVITLIVLLVAVFIYHDKQEKNTNNSNITEDQNNWLTYEDSIYDYSINYPNDWQIEVLPDFKEGAVDKENVGISLTKIEASKRYPFYIFIENNPDQISAKDWAKKILNEQGVQSRLKDVGQTKINSYEAYQLTGFFTTEYTEQKTFLSHGDKIFIFAFPEAEENTNILNPQENNEIVQQIISTFVFLINKDVKTYENKDVGIKFQYPKSFGNAMERIWSVEKGEIVTSGKAFELYFENNNREIGLTLTSKDFEVYISDSYNGEKLTDLCPATKVDDKGNGCIIRKFGDKEVLEQTKYVAGEGSYDLIHTYSMPWSGKSGYFGLELSQWFPEIYDKMTQDEKKNEKIAREYAQRIIFQKDIETLEKEIKKAETIISSLTEI